MSYIYIYFFFRGWSAKDFSFLKKNEKEKNMKQWTDDIAWNVLWIISDLTCKYRFCYMYLQMFMHDQLFCNDIKVNYATKYDYQATNMISISV